MAFDSNSLPSHPEDASLRIRVKLQSEMGRYKVTLSRGKREYSRSFLLEHDEQRERFLDSAVKAMADMRESPVAIREQIDARLQGAIQNHYFIRDRPILEKMSTIIDDETTWLWPGRIPAGKLTMLIGNSGVGKSLLSLEIAARVTTGRPWPDEPLDTPQREPASVLLMSEIDDPSDIIRPRLAALGADLERVSLLRTLETTGPRREHAPFSFLGTFEMLKTIIPKMNDCRLVIIDPLTTYLEVNNSRRDIQMLLTSLIEVAHANRVAILAVGHFHTSLGRTLIGRTKGISSFIAATPLAWGLVPDRQCRERRLLLPIKNNLERASHGCAFRIETCDQFETARIEWETEPLAIAADGTVVDVSSFTVRGTQRLPGAQLSQQERASEWLKLELNAGARLSREILAAAREQQIGESTLRSAFHQLGGVTRKSPEGPWLWMLSNVQPNGDSTQDSAETGQLGNEKSTTNITKFTTFTNLDEEKIDLERVADRRE